MILFGGELTMLFWIKHVKGNILLSTSIRRYCSPENLKMGSDIKEHLNKKGVEFSEEIDLDNVLSKMDVIYMTRIQKERISKEDYEKAKGKYVINISNLHLINKNSRVLHPLPHIEEIDIPIDIEEHDKRIAYFRQAENGLYIRMALLDMILNEG